MTPPARLTVSFLDLKAQFRSIEAEVRAALDQVLESCQFIGGEWVERFEREFAEYVGARFAVAVSSGTTALELALKCAGIGPGNEVIVPANSFFATAEAVSNVGARPLFADVCPETYHLSLESVKCLLTPKTSAIIPVHLYGRAMDLQGLVSFAEGHGLRIIEDAAQAHGCELGGRRIGGSGRLTCFSFYPGKNLGAYGDAGAVTTSDPDDASKLRLLRDHGSPSKYRHTLVGTNARLDVIQAAVLLVKLPHLEGWNTLRRRHAEKYHLLLAGAPLQLPVLPPESEHVFHLFVVATPRRDDLRSFLESRGIGTGIHYPVPLHLTEAYQLAGYPGPGSAPVAERLAREILSLPMYAELTDHEIGHTAASINEFFGRN